MSIKRFLARLVEKITGRKCCRCRYNVVGRCSHPSDKMFMQCWHGITRPGFEYSPSVEGYNDSAEVGEAVKAGMAAGDMTPEEKHQMEKIVASLQEASETAKDGGLLEG